MPSLVSAEEARQIAAEVEQWCHEAAVKAAEMAGITVEEGLRLERDVSLDASPDDEDYGDCPGCGCPATIYPDDLAPHPPSEVLHWRHFGKPCPVCGWSEIAEEPVNDNWKQEGF